MAADPSWSIALAGRKAKKTITLKLAGMQTHLLRHSFRGWLAFLISDMEICEPNTHCNLNCRKSI